VGASATLALLDDMFNIACVVPPCICPHGARNGTPESFSAPCYVARFVPVEVAAGWALKAEHIRGDWRAYVLAQDVNDADPSMDPAEAATHIGSFPVHTPFKIHIKPNPTCPEPADAIVTVT